MTDEVNRLRGELAAQTQQLVQMTLEQAVREGRMAPAGREAFYRRHRDGGTVEQAREWIASQPRPQSFTRSASRATGPGATHAAPDAAILAEIEADRERHYELTGERISFERQCPITMARVLRTNRELVNNYLAMPGEV